MSKKDDILAADEVLSIEHEPIPLKTSRIEMLADGVFAIVVTLLVIDIHVPQLTGPIAAIELPHSLESLIPRILSYVMSFLIVGIYWIGHHQMSHYIKRADRPFLWLNIIYLMFVAFLPFSTALLAQYTDQPIAVAIYGFNLILSGLALFCIWWYASHKHRLIDKDLSGEFIYLVKKRILTAPLLYILAIIFAFLSTKISLVIFIIVQAIYIIPSQMIDRFWDER